MFSWKRGEVKFMEFNKKKKKFKEIFYIANIHHKKFADHFS